MKALLFGEPPDEDEVRPRPDDDWRRCWPASPSACTRSTTPASCGPTGWSPGRSSRASAAPTPSSCWATSARATSTTPCRPSPRSPTSRATRWWPRWSRSDPRPAALDVGQRVVLNPWLTCGPRGIDPPCPPCQAGDLSLCWSFTKGDLGPGVHVGVITDAPGAWAERLAAHDSMLIPVPDGITDEAAVLADPFSVSFHAIVRHPPPPAGRAAGLRRRRAGPDQRGHPAHPLPRRRGGRGGPLRGPARDGPAVRGRPWSSPTSPGSALVEALARLVRRRPAHRRSTACP